MCPRHYKIWRRAQGAGFTPRKRFQPRMTVQDVLNRVAAIALDANGCRDGRGHFSIGSDGYPKVKLDKRTQRVSRIVLAARLGRRLGFEMMACHTCDHPWCLAAFHLWEGSNSANQVDSFRKGRMPDRRGEKSPTAKLTEAQVREIRASTEPGVVLARRFRVADPTISVIRSGKTWKHVA